MLYNSEQIVEQVHQLEDRLEVPPQSLVVIGGAALALFDIKEATDIDISASVRVMNRVHSRLDTEQREGACGTILDAYDPFEIANGWGHWDHSYIRRNAFIHKGVAVLRAAHVVAWKSEHARPHDKQDIFDTLRHVYELGAKASDTEFRWFLIMHRFTKHHSIPKHDCPHHGPLPEGANMLEVPDTLAETPGISTY